MGLVMCTYWQSGHVAIIAGDYFFLAEKHISRFYPDLLTMLLCVKRLTGFPMTLLSVRELTATSLGDLPKQRPMTEARTSE